MCSKESGRRKIGRSQKNIDLVQQTFEENPTTMKGFTLLLILTF